MHTIKVCFASLHAAHPFFGMHGRVGGAEIQVYYMARGIAEDPRFEAHVFTAALPHAREDAVKEDVHVHPFFDLALPFKRVRAIAGVFRLWRLLWRLRPDVCIERAPGFESFAVMLFCMVFPTRLMYMVSQEVGESRAAHYGMESLARWIFFKIMLRYADVVLVQHEGQETVLRTHFKRASVVRRNAFPVLSAPQEACEKNAGVLWVGRCDPWKRPEAFIALARAFPSARFTMVCPPSSGRRYFERVEREAQGVPNLAFFEQVPFSAIQHYFNRAEMLVNTSVNEGFSNTFLQAFGAGIPVVSLASDPGGILERFHVGRCAGNDAAILEGFVRELHGDSAARHTMGEAGRRYLADFHNLADISRADRDFVVGLLAAPERTPLFIEFLKYGVGGGFAFLVNFFCVFLFTDVFKIHYLVSTIMSYPIAFTVGFLFQAFVTFKARGRMLQKLLFFLAHQSLGFALFVGLMYSFTDLLGVYYLISFIISAGLVYIFNFSISKLLVFR